MGRVIRRFRSLEYNAVPMGKWLPMFRRIIGSLFAA
jgi:hypothetical protein